MLLGGAILALGLRVGDLRFIHQPARQRALLEQLLAAVQDFLGVVARLAGGFQIGLRFDDRFGNSGAFGGAKIRFGLLHRALALRGGRDQIAVLEDGQQLSLL